LNHIWLLLPGFILWQIWKERNKSIFHSKDSPLELTWNRVVTHIKETVRSKSWQESDRTCPKEELSILQNWQLNLIDLKMEQAPKTHIPSPSTWTPPSIGYVKVNFGGASKGNPRPAGYGAVIRDSTRKLLMMIAGHMGETTNNVAELTGLIQGLQLAISLPNQRIILKGDSQVIIRLITKILHGASPHKNSPSWRLAGLLELFGNLCNRSLSIIPSHVRRTANGVDDYLTNEGVQRYLEHTIWDARSLEDSDIPQHCQLLAHKDFLPPDGVLRDQPSHMEAQLGHMEVPAEQAINTGHTPGCAKLSRSPASVIH
jgi:ribonuclease HI